MKPRIFGERIYALLLADEAAKRHYCPSTLTVTAVAKTPFAVAALCTYIRWSVAIDFCEAKIISKIIGHFSDF